MTETALYGRREIAAITGAPEDAVIFWISKDLLKSVDVGPRQHRRFSEREVRIAALLTEARGYGMNVGAMTQIVDKLRASLALHDAIPDLGFLVDAWRDVNWELYGAEHPEPVDDLAQRKAFAETIKEDQYCRRIYSENDLADLELTKAALPRDREGIRSLKIAYCFVGGDYLTVYCDGQGSFDLDAGMPRELGHRSALVFNVGELYKALDWDSVFELPKANRPKRVGKYEENDTRVLFEIAAGLKAGKFPNLAQAIDVMMDRVEGPSLEAKRRRLYRAVTTMHDRAKVIQSELDESFAADDIIEGVSNGTYQNRAEGIEAALHRVGGDLSDAAKKLRLRRAVAAREKLQ